MSCADAASNAIVVCENRVPRFGVRRAAFVNAVESSIANRW